MYLKKEIVDAKQVPIDPRGSMTRMGYTKNSGAPSSTMIRLQGEKVWRRVMILQYSNASTAFVRVKGEKLVIPSSFIPTSRAEASKFRRSSRKFEEGLRYHRYLRKHLEPGGDYYGGESTDELRARVRKLTRTRSRR